jgi:hypothetical protein
MKCHNCSKNAMFMVGPENAQVPLCLDCNIRFDAMMQRQIEEQERHLNYLASEMEVVAGVPGTLPRYPEQRRVVHTGAITLNNIHVSNSNVGVISTGTLQNVDATVTVLKTGGNAELASAVAALAQALIESRDMANATKNQALEILGALAAEAVAPKPQRKTAVVRALLSELSNILGGVAALAGVWTKAKALLEQLLS